MSEKPNIFSFATSELSQDAFIAWLLSWADQKYADIDPQLHRCGRKLVEAFFEKHKKPMPEYSTAVVTRQVANIDVLCVLDEQYVILIEDKTHTGAHSNQLERYLEEVIKKGYSPDKILPIYFKTGDQSCYEAIHSKGYQPFLRQDFLTVLESGQGTSSDIFQSYLSHLQHLEDQIESYRTSKLNDWGWHAWIGFYKALKLQLGEGNWGYVPNQSGGFLGYWLGFHGIGHVQLANNQELRFRISVNDASQRSSLRRQWFKQIAQNSEAFGFKTKKPLRFGSGESMVVALLDASDFRQQDEHGYIDMAATADLVRQAKALLQSFEADATFDTSSSQD